MTGRPEGAWPGIALSGPALDIASVCRGFGRRTARPRRPPGRPARGARRPLCPHGRRARGARRGRQRPHARGRLPAGLSQLHQVPVGVAHVERGDRPSGARPRNGPTSDPRYPSRARWPATASIGPSITSRQRSRRARSPAGSACGAISAPAAWRLIRWAPISRARRPSPNSTSRAPQRRVERDGPVQIRGPSAPGGRSRGAARGRSGRGRTLPSSPMRGARDPKSSATRARTSPDRARRPALACPRPPAGRPQARRCGSVPSGFSVTWSTPPWTAAAERRTPRSPAKSPDGVGDQPALVHLHAAHHVRAAAHDEVGAGVDHGVGEGPGRRGSRRGRSRSPLGTCVFLAPLGAGVDHRRSPSRRRARPAHRAARAGMSVSESAHV